MQRKIRLGMVGGGCGALIGAVHRIAARLDGHYELVAGVFSTDPQNNQQSAGDLHIDPDRVYGDFGEMARTEANRDDGIDAVAVVTPNHLHFPIAQAFLEAGIHVICDKPLTTTLADAQSLADLVAQTGLVFAVTYNYTGYPLVRQARQMVRAGVLGNLRIVRAEYLQDWLSTPLEESGQKQALWRTDPAKSGAGGCIGDIGTHAFHLMQFITGQAPEQISADLETFVAGRQLDDHATVRLKLRGDTRGFITASQVSPGHENDLAIRLYGDKASLEWRQENPNVLVHCALGETRQIITRGGANLDPAAAHATRIPPGHPEGYLEAFAQLYTDVAGKIRAHALGQDPDPADMLVPDIDDGVAGVRFVARSVASHQAGAQWLAFGE
ncbi:MAG: Gfo/Idh/MocA family protein [Alphaproteobacteria bacterium]